MAKVGFRRSKFGTLKNTLRRVADLLSAVLILLSVAIAAAWFGRLGEQAFEGQFKVVDGDSLEISETRMRLEGIDAPEWRQTCRADGNDWNCGRQSASALRQLINGRDTVCSGFADDQYGRLLVTCYGGGVNINREMVSAGWAFAYGAYEGDEAVARQAGRGIWRGEVVPPRQWRKINGLPDEAATTGMDSFWNRLMSWLSMIVGHEKRGL